MDFAEVEREVAKLRQELAAGRTTEKQFKARLKEMMVEDEQGNWWMVGYATGRWYRHDGTDWVREDPPGHGLLDSELSPSPQVRPVAIRTGRRSALGYRALGALIGAVGWTTGAVIGGSLVYDAIPSVTMNEFGVGIIVSALFVGVAGAICVSSWKAAIMAIVGAAITGAFVWANYGIAEGAFWGGVAAALGAGIGAAIERFTVE